MKKYLENLPSLNISADDLIGKNADQAGEYIQHINCSAELLNVAYSNEVFTKEEVDTLILDFKNAKNAMEVLNVQTPMLRIMYRAAVDYSDILYKHKIIDQLNFNTLKLNISRGSNWTNEDLNLADAVDGTAARISDTLSNEGTINPSDMNAHLQDLAQMKKNEQKKT